MVKIIISLLLLPMSLIGNGDEPPYVKLADRITAKHIQEMKALGFALYMTGGSFFYDVEKINLGFKRDIAPTINETRVMYIHATQKLLKQINDDSLIQPYLHNQPFNIDNLYYQMSFKRDLLPKGTDKSVAYVSTIDGVIWYAAYDPSSERGNPLSDLYSERYEDAVRIVAEQESNCAAPSILEKNNKGWLASLRDFIAKLW